MANYQWLTLTEAETQLAQRLADPDSVLWTRAELDLYLQDSLRQWNCLTATWKTDFAFSNPGPSVWTDFGTLPSSPRQRSVTDNDIYTLMEYMLLEPPTGANWTGSSQFSIDDLSQAVSNRRDEIIQATNCNHSRIAVPAMPNERRYPLTDETLEPQRIAYLESFTPDNPFVVAVNLSASKPGNFTIAHGAPSTPVFVLITMTSGGEFWLQSPGFDATNLYLTASQTGITGIAYCFLQAPDAILPFTTTTGNFSVAHGLGVAPAIGFIELDSGGAVWFQPTPWDASDVYLVGGQNAISGRVILYSSVPFLATASYQEVTIPAVISPGVFTIQNPLGALPSVLLVRPSSSGVIWVPSLPDSGTIYLEASQTGVSCVLEMWAFATTQPTGKTALVRDDTLAMEFFQDRYYQQDSGTPTAWMVASEPPLSFDVDIAPNYEGGFEVLILKSGVELGPPTPTILEIPNDFSWVIRWGALADLLNRESEATDRLRGGWCQKRYHDGLQLMLNTPWIMLGNVNGIAADVPGFLDLDRYDPEWESEDFDQVVTAGIDYLASPVGTGAVVTVLANAPFVDVDGYVQVSRSAWEAVLNYAQFLASFKQGGQEFTSALELEKAFLLAAASENRRLIDLGLYSDVLTDRAIEEIRVQERA